MTAPPHAPPPGGRTRDADATRQRLLRAALELFTAGGFHATTTPMLAERAGVAEGTIYRHFPSKERLYSEVVRATFRWATGVVAEFEADRSVGHRERLRRLGHRFAESGDRDPAAARLVFRRLDDALLDERGRAAVHEFRGAVERVVAGAKADGLIRPGPAGLWASAWLVLVGFVAERVASREWTLDSPNVGQLLEAAWQAIGAAPPPPA